MHETRTILGDIYDAWRDQDLDRLASYLPDDFCHTINFPTDLHHAGGSYAGKQAVLARWQQVFSEFDCEQLETPNLMVDRNHAAAEVSVHCRHRATGLPFATIKAHFWTVESGWPVRLNEYYDVGDIQAFVSAVAERASA
ncbi:MAG: nuclear transport factor 2 family protein [Methyloceanibacter sp.]|uniref:nuclear transport factor 2 family protein n=1 Tax=Methyloceanibacter sp. TaxID=1965321 RepID=UPI003D6CD9CF